MQLSENLSQDLARWYRGQQVANPGLDAPELWATNLTDQQRAVRQEMILRWMREKEAALRVEIGGAIKEPALTTIAHPQTTSAADVVSSYDPQGPAVSPPAPASGDPRRAKALIETGRTHVDDDRAAAQASRSNSVQGSLNVQLEVHRDHDRGFFVDFNLRK